MLDWHTLVQSILQFLRDPAWGAIGVICGITSAILSFLAYIASTRHKDFASHSKEESRLGNIHVSPQRLRTISTAQTKSKSLKRRIMLLPLKRPKQLNQRYIDNSFKKNLLELRLLINAHLLNSRSLSIVICLIFTH